MLPRLITLSSFAALCAVSQAQFFAASGFDASAEGWRGDTCNGGFSWRPSGGSPDGYLQWAEPCSSTFVVAPIQYLGDWSSLIGTGAIDFNLRIDHLPSNGSALPYEVRLSGPLGSAKWLATPPTSVHGWRHFQIPLDAASWQLTSGNWVDLMHGIGRFEIRIRQFSNTDQTQVTGLDSVRVGVVPEPASCLVLAPLVAIALRRRRRSH
jgi:hypothetical protein